MHDRTTGTSLLAALLAAACLTGCAQAPAEPLTNLPVHELDLQPLPVRPEPVDVVAVPAEPTHRKDHPWAVETYRPWRYIVIHHSATDFGNAEVFDASHRDSGFDELGYHFVINNGRGGADGIVQVGSRWRKQKWGAHTGGTPNNEYNNYGIGICLVGDFTNHLPSAAQLKSLQRLTAYLAETYDIPAARLIGHRDAPNANTECPGRRLHEYIYDTLRPRLERRALASKRR